MGQQAYEIVWGKRAIKQLQKAYEYIAEDSLQNAIAVRNSIAEMLAKAALNPERFTPDKYKRVNAGFTYRSFTKHHYRVSYRIGKSAVKIIRIRHTKQQPTFY